MISINLKNKISGYVFVLISVLSFSSMAITVKYLYSISTIPATEVAFFRFLVGFTVLSFIKLTFAIPVKPKNLYYVLERGISNTLAVLLFFYVINLIPVTKANLYNMTYPIFVAIFAHFMIAEKVTLKSFIAIIIGFTGIFLIVRPDSFLLVQQGDLIGISSGIVAGYAVVALKRARTTDNSFTIVYFLMGIGLVITTILTSLSFVVPTTKMLTLLVLLALFSLIGQYTLTFAYRFITSVEGAVTSSLRIFVVAVLGTVFFGDVLSINVLIGGLLIFLSIVVINLSSR